MISFRNLRRTLIWIPFLWAPLALAVDQPAPFPDDPACTAADRKFMARAFELAYKSLRRGDNGIGAVLVKDGKIICEYGNTVHTDSDITMHGETGLISHASRVLEKSMWKDCTLYTSLEPCIMCCGSIHNVGIKTVVYGGTNRLPNLVPLPVQRLRIREVYQRMGWDITVRGPLMDEEQLKLRAEAARMRNKKT